LLCHKKDSVLTPGIAHWLLSLLCIATNSRTFFPPSSITPALVRFHLKNKMQFSNDWHKTQMEAFLSDL